VRRLRNERRAGVENKEEVTGGVREVGKSVRFEVLTAVTMKNVVFWDIRTQFVTHRRHITSPLQSPTS
jgi:hypothetical protein